MLLIDDSMRILVHVLVALHQSAESNAESIRRLRSFTCSCSHRPEDDAEAAAAGISSSIGATHTLRRLYAGEVTPGTVG